jgi:hypothetical protein
MNSSHLLRAFASDDYDAGRQLHAQSSDYQRRTNTKGFKLLLLYVFPALALYSN